jgi:hypothetical protein
MPASRSDERIVSARLVPYNTVAYVADPPGLERRAEIFHTDAFRDQLVDDNPHTVSLDVGHQRDAPIGHAVELKNVGSSLFGAFRIHNTRELHPDKRLDPLHTVSEARRRRRPPAQAGIPGQRRAHRHARLPGGNDPRRPERQPPRTLRPIHTRARRPEPGTPRSETRCPDKRAVRGMVRAATTRQTPRTARHPHTSANARVIALHKGSPLPTARAAPHRRPRQPPRAPSAAPTMPTRRRTHTQARLR